MSEVEVVELSGDDARWDMTNEELEAESERASRVGLSDIQRMYDEADDYEAAVLDELKLRAGITWACPQDGWYNIEAKTRCERCGYERERP